MAVLVTGGAGYIGSHLVWSLNDPCEQVVVLDRLSTGFRSAIPSGVRFYRGDVGDTALLKRIFTENSIAAIIHLAGSSVVSESVADPLSYYQNNTARTRTLVESAVDAGIQHFVFSSTAAVYGSQEGTPSFMISHWAAAQPAHDLETVERFAFQRLLFMQMESSRLTAVGAIPKSFPLWADSHMVPSKICRKYATALAD